MHCVSIFIHVKGGIISNIFFYFGLKSQREGAKSLADVSQIEKLSGIQIPF